MISKQKAIVCVFQWNSLRVRDQPLFANPTCIATDFLVNVHVIDDVWESLTKKGTKRASPRRREYYMDSLHSLNHELISRGSGLLVLKGDTVRTVARAVQKLSETHDVSGVYLEAANTVEESRRVFGIQQSIHNLGIDVIVKPNAQTMLKADFVDSSNLPNTFTQFRIMVEKDSTGSILRPIFETPKKLPPMPADLQISTILQENPSSYPVDPRSAFPFAGGEKAGLERIQNYFNKTNGVRTYKETRNQLIGSEYSSKLSPYLAFGSISAATVLQKLKQYERDNGANESTYWLFFELLWHDYFQFIAKKYGKQLYILSGISSIPPAYQWIYNPQTFNAWTKGLTGIPFLDANMRELAATGFMSNRGRQNVASFLVRDLNIPWIYGAEWFEEQLLDHDPCSNYGNWQYVSGVGNDPRADRYFNVIKQGKDYDPNGEYIKLWCPELVNVPAEMIHHPWKMTSMQQKDSQVTLGVSYPLPIVEADAWKKHYTYLSKGKLGRANPGESIYRHKKK